LQKFNQQYGEISGKKDKKLKVEVKKINDSYLFPDKYLTNK